MNTITNASQLPTIARPSITLTCINFYCAHTVPHYPAYHLDGGDRMYACSACNTTQRVLRHIWEASERGDSCQDVPAQLDAPKRAQPLSWTNAYGHAAKNGAPGLAHYIATRQYLRAKSAGDAVNASRWNHRRYDSANALLSGSSAMSRALCGRA